jgi:hypothetical protein
MHQESNGEVRNTLLLAGGAALMVLGVGLVIAHPGVRKALLAGLTPLLPELQGQFGDGIGGVLPDVERYLKLRAM